MQELQKNKSGKIKIILTAVGLLLLFGLIYWFVWRQSAVEPAEMRIQPAKSGLERLEELLRITEYRDLRKFGPWPLPIEPKGKSNPFLNSSPN